MILLCPVCSLPLKEEEKCAFCEKGHFFDRARQGHLNLLTDSSSHGHGDDKNMLLARRRFLESGHYEFLARKIAERVADRFPTEGVFLDAGCGEGYYTEKVAKELKRTQKKADIFAFDISKDAARFTSSRMNKNGHFFVASTFHIPMESSSVDLAMSLFAPYSENEFLRVLKKGGFLLRAVPLTDHLWELKCALYDRPVKNESAAAIGEGFRFVGEETLKSRIRLTSREEIISLFEMTPYAHKTAQGDRAKLEALDELETTVEFGVLLYEKK